MYGTLCSSWVAFWIERDQEMKLTLVKSIIDFLYNSIALLILDDHGGFNQWNQLLVIEFPN